MLRRQDSIKCNAHPKTTHPHLTIQYNMLQFKCHAPHNLNIQFQFQLMRLIWNAKVSLVNLVAKGGRGLEEGRTRTLVQVRISASSYLQATSVFLCPTSVCQSVSPGTHNLICKLRRRGVSASPQSRISLLLAIVSVPIF